MKKIVSVVSVLVSFAAIAASIWFFLNAQLAIDWFNVRQFQPSSEIQSLATESGMNSKGRFLFYATRPTILDQKDFNQECQSKEKGSSILGCYSKDRIYIYNVTDQRLNGVKEVTAAHEMLHAAYSRLSETDRNRVNQLVENEAKRFDNNPDFKKRMDYYARVEPGSRQNELHSIIGSEITSVSPELEKYYSRYFDNRKKLVAHYDNYHDKFVYLESEYTVSGKNLESLARDINQKTKEYTAKTNALNAKISSFNYRAQAGDFGSQAQFQAERNALVAESDSLNQLRSQIETETNQYNRERERYNSLVDESNQMYEALDSTKGLAPSPTL